MANRGKNSKKRNLWREQAYIARTFTFQYAFQDKIIKETVCTDTTEEIEDHLEESFPNEPLVFFPDSQMDGMVLLSPLQVSFWENALMPVPDLKNGRTK